MIKLFWGENKYQIDKELEKLQEKNPAEIHFIEGVGARDFIASLASSSFFNDQRLFIANEVLSGLTEKQLAALSVSLENLDKNTDVIFVESTKLKSAKALNLIKKYGTVVEFSIAKNPNLVSFIKEQCEKEGGKIAPLAVERLASFVGSDHFQLEEEIKKLVLYKAGDEDNEIQTADVELLTHANFEATIFELTDAIAAKNNRKAAALIHSFLSGGENEIYLLTMIARQFRNIAIAKFETNISAEKLSKIAGIHPYVAKKSLSQANNFDKSEVIAMYQKLCDADLKLKSNANPAQTLLRLVA